MTFLDAVYLLMLAPAFVVPIWAAVATRRRFVRWAAVRNAMGLTGAEVARRILAEVAMRDVKVEPYHGYLSDHYDAGARTLRLSPEVFHGRSVSALAVAAHEIGHALQQKVRYLPLFLRSAAVPMAAFGSNVAFVLFFLGMLIQQGSVAYVGIILYGATVALQLLTLPIELDASRRAKQILDDRGMLSPSERVGVERVLDAAAWTYVAASVTAFLTLFYFALRIGMLRRREE